MEKKAHIYYNKENVLPDRTTRGELQMMRMLKIMFIILVGIGMLVMGIYTFIRLKKRRRELKRLLDNIASGSTVDQLLKENHPKLSAMDEMEKYIYIIMGLGAGFVWSIFHGAGADGEKCHTGYDRNDRVDACAAAGCICIRHHSPFYRKWHEEETGKRK